MTNTENPTEVKTEKVEPIRNWVEHESFKHRKVYTGKGVSIILAVHFEPDTADGAAPTEPSRALVEVMETGEKYDLSFKTLRFKAVNEDYRDKYVVDKTVKTASGAPSLSNGDEVAEALKGLTIEELAGVANENGLTEAWESWRKKNLNLGMRRMNLGNMLRNKAKKGVELVFFGKPVAEHMTVRGKEIAERAAAAEAAKAEAKAKAEEERKAKREAEASAKAEAKAAAKAAKEATKEATTPKSKRKNKKVEDTPNADSEADAAA